MKTFYRKLHNHFVTLSNEGSDYNIKPDDMRFLVVQNRYGKPVLCVIFHDQQLAVNVAKQLLDQYGIGSQANNNQTQKQTPSNKPGTEWYIYLDEDELLKISEKASLPVPINDKLCRKLSLCVGDEYRIENVVLKDKVRLNTSAATKNVLSQVKQLTDNFAEIDRNNNKFYQEILQCSEILLRYILPHIELDEETLSYLDFRITQNHLNINIDEFTLKNKVKQALQIAYEKNSFNELESLCLNNHPKELDHFFTEGLTEIIYLKNSFDHSDSGVIHHFIMWLLNNNKLDIANKFVKLVHIQMNQLPIDDTKFTILDNKILGVIIDKMSLLNPLKDQELITQYFSLIMKMGNIDNLAFSTCKSKTKKFIEEFLTEEKINDSNKDKLFTFLLLNYPLEMNVQSKKLILMDWITRKQYSLVKDIIQLDYFMIDDNAINKEGCLSLIEFIINFNDVCNDNDLMAIFDILYHNDLYREKNAKKSNNGHRSSMDKGSVEYKKKLIANIIVTLGYIPPSIQKDAVIFDAQMLSKILIQAILKNTNNLCKTISKRSDINKIILFKDANEESALNLAIQTNKFNLINDWVTSYNSEQILVNIVQSLYLSRTSATIENKYVAEHISSLCHLIFAAQRSDDRDFQIKRDETLNYALIKAASQNNLELIQAIMSDTKFVFDREACDKDGYNVAYHLIDQNKNSNKNSQEIINLLIKLYKENDIKIDSTIPFSAFELAIKQNKYSFAYAIFKTVLFNKWLFNQDVLKKEQRQYINDNSDKFWDIAFSVLSPKIMADYQTSLDKKLEKELDDFQVIDKGEGSSSLLINNSKNLSSSIDKGEGSSSSLYAQGFIDEDDKDQAIQFLEQLLLYGKLPTLTVNANTTNQQQCDSNQQINSKKLALIAAFMASHSEISLEQSGNNALLGPNDSKNIFILNFVYKKIKLIKNYDDLMEFSVDTEKCLRKLYLNDKDKNKSYQKLFEKINTDINELIKLQLLKLIKNKDVTLDEVQYKTNDEIKNLESVAQGEIKYKINNEFKNLGKKRNKFDLRQSNFLTIFNLFMLNKDQNAVKEYKLESSKIKKALNLGKRF